MDNKAADERFIAKTTPRKDIQWHTDDLLDNFKLLKELYPNLKIDWELLRLACIYHDLGKMNDTFQQCVHGKVKSTGIPHGFLSLGFIDVEYLEELGYEEKDIRALFQAVAYHHERDVYLEEDEISREIVRLAGVFKNFEYRPLPSRHLDARLYKSFFRLGTRPYESRDGEYFFKTIMLKGLLNRIDSAASAGIDVEKPAGFLPEAMEILLNGWKKDNPGAGWNELQKYMLENRNENVVVVAQTGMGKTEAGLLWLGDSKGFFTLPLKSAINAIYKRIAENIAGKDMENRVALLHSDTLKVYTEQEESNKYKKKSSEADDIREYESAELEGYYTRTRQLSLPLTICTLDQIFDFVYRYKGFELKLATLSYSKVIVDEIQMYSPDLIAYLILGLKYITRMGGRFAILTATLPGVILDLMKDEGICFKGPETFTNWLVRHSIMKIDSQIDEDSSIAEMARAYNKNKLLIICNTVRKAKTVYNKLKAVLQKETGDESVEHLQLLHSGFIREERSKKEDRIMELGKKGSTGCGIWVTTQLVEASLDIDFDLLYTELSDLNGLFQRMGRCCRHRKLDKEYNCFVFTGGNKKCSGVGSFIDEKIHQLSKEALYNGVLNETAKAEMIKETYSTEKLKDTGYYSDIKSTIQYVKDISSYEMDKGDVNKVFRDIDQVSVIPLSVYKEHEEDIGYNIGIIKSREYSKKEKVKAREALRDLMVPVQRRLAEETKVIFKKISNGFDIIAVDAEYSIETGISFEKTGKEEFRNAESRMF
ncbi:CRISPR-associated helicase/endonuclease Cas3 [Ruminiclostridium cellobioparum]|uniref:CRISPR-associated helicase/endonuclease Cas3 n=1 Tax=Ruminiclostridium cellobioparum TaxID=29355 RepID=UPI000482666E|nr:CRISPR-associated helicase/endonuclease Cas3 [Ruminiclostridium cellobioparum]